jgi:hypothetical protein
MGWRGWVVACGGLSIVGACAIDESGQSGGDSGLDAIASDTGSSDSGGTDVAIDVPLPPSCTTIDISCLFDAGVPDGWAPYVAEMDGGACPPSGFTASSWVARAALAPGACTCSCDATGTFSCDGPVTIVNGGACGNPPFTVDSGACTANSVISSHLQLLDLPDATSVGVGCVADASAPSATSDPVTLCAGSCDAGPVFCAQPAGSRCIATDGVQACPPTFTQTVVGASAVAACNACGCSPSAPPPCTANATVYYGYLAGGYQANTNCSTGGMWTSQTEALDGSCQNFSANYDSLEVTMNAVPAPTCASNGGGGDAGLSTVKTVCCK